MRRLGKGHWFNLPGAALIRRQVIHDCFPLASLAHVLGLCARTTGVRRVRVAGKLGLFVLVQAQRRLEAAANLHEHLAAHLGGPPLAAARAAGPQPDAVEALAHVDDDAHDLAVVLVLERLADGGQHDVQPQRVDVDAALVLELIGPLAAVLVLLVLPLGLDAGLEEVVVRLLGQLRGRSDVVLAVLGMALCWGGLHRCPRTPRPSRRR
jgi:hypothetical protein